MINAPAVPRLRFLHMSKAPLALLACAAIACRGTAEPDRQVAAIAVVSGVRAGARMGERLPDDIVVMSVNAAGAPVGGVAITAAASHGGAAYDARSTGSTIVTDGEGTATVGWTLGPTYGEQTLTLSAPGAADVVLRAHAAVPLTAVVTVTLADSIITVGSSTTAHATVTTASGEVIPGPHVFQWGTSSSVIATLSAPGVPPSEGSPTVAKGPVTITAISPGRVQVSASINIAISVGSVTSRTGFGRVTVRPICNLSTATPLDVGQTVGGTMTATDCLLDTGAPYDTYRLTLPVGQRVQVNLASSSYDPYLILLDANGNWLTGDDWSGGGTTARITFTAETTTYYLQATSLAPGVIGTYTLSTQTVP